MLIRNILFFIFLTFSILSFGESEVAIFNKGETTGTIGEREVDIYSWGDGDISGTIGDEDVALYEWKE